MKNPLTLAGFEPATFRFVAQHLNHCATAVPPKGEYNIKISVKEVGLQGVDCIHLDQGTDKWQALAKAAMRLRVPLKGEKFLDHLWNLVDKKDPAA